MTVYGGALKFAVRGITQTLARDLASLSMLMQVLLDSMMFDIAHFEPERCSSNNNTYWTWLKLHHKVKPLSWMVECSSIKIKNTEVGINILTSYFISFTIKETRSKNHSQRKWFCVGYNYLRPYFCWNVHTSIAWVRLWRQWNGRGLMRNFNTDQWVSFCLRIQLFHFVFSWTAEL